ncbi:UNVERIFIED_CONTAM: Transposon Ty3-G Gag-Pol polyprotein [Sesamum latifolium]|uniref:Transposon Ty3-G Gag-Pol polyprotein n=1 Tax=Sesamum latifolium TaxID=2727402 RepID=A0AAW2TB02_9LAMI
MAEQRRVAPRIELGGRTGEEQVKKENLPTTGIIGVISGGPASGDSMRARKAVVREAINATNEANHVAFSEIVATQYENPKSEITFSDQDLEGHLPANNDAIVISVTVSNFWVKKILIDSGSSTYILFHGAFAQIDTNKLTPVNTPLTSFSGDIVKAEEIASNDTRQASRRNLPRRGGRQIPRGKQRRKVEQERMKASEEVKIIEFFGDPLKAVKIGSSLDPPFEDDLINFLQEHSDVFVWETSDMQGISSKVMVHMLNVHPEARPIKQKKKAFEIDRNKIIKEEVEKLLKVNYIRPVQYPEWLANVVLVPKSNGKWRMCIDFTGLNRACPKDSFPLPRIDAMIDSTSGCELMSFLDAFQGYNQIQLAPKDQEKTSFVTEQGAYCYTIEQCQAAFKDLKKCLASPSLLTKLRPGETLFLYLAISEGAVSAVLVREEGREHQPIYYVSKTLQGPKERYPQIEKLALALVTTARKLRLYFQLHPVVVLTNHPLKKILADPNISGRMVKWSIELSEHGIEYQPRPTIKAQPLADFISKLTGIEDPQKIEWWKIFVDGSSTSLKSGTGIVIETPQGDRLQYAIKFDFAASNNEVEYEALITGRGGGN